MVSTNAAYSYYGGRGVKVCERWLDFNNFLSDMGIRPPGTTLDRIDTNGNYEPSNCRWATVVEQGRNKRNNTVYTAHNTSKPLSAWAEDLGIDRRKLTRWIKKHGTLEAVIAYLKESESCRVS